MKRRSKFNATKVWMCEQGHQFPFKSERCPIRACSQEQVKFDSKKEANRWTDLRRLEKAGKISKLERQPRFFLLACNPHKADPGQIIKIRSKGYPNGRQAAWTADFKYFEDGELVVEDSKGMDTPDSRLRRAIVEAMLGIEIRVT